MANGTKYQYDISNKGKLLITHFLFSSTTFDSWGEMIDYLIKKCEVEICDKIVY